MKDGSLYTATSLQNPTPVHWPQSSKNLKAKQLWAMPADSSVCGSHPARGSGSKNGDVGKGKSPKSASLLSRAREAQAGGRRRERLEGGERPARKLQPCFPERLQTCEIWIAIDFFLPGVTGLCVLCPPRHLFGQQTDKFLGSDPSSVIVAQSPGLRCAFSSLTLVPPQTYWQRSPW